MRKLSAIATLVSIVSVLGLLSCSENEEEIPTYVPLPPDYILTYEEASWTYDVKTYSSSYENYAKTETVSSIREIGGTTYQVMVATYSGESDYYERTFFADDGSTLFAHRGVEYEEKGEIAYYNDYGQEYPIYKYPFVIGEAWDIYSVTDANPSEVPVFAFYWAFYTDDVDGDEIDDTMDLTVSAEVIAQEDRTVPAGTFEDCYVVKFTMSAVYHLSGYGDLHGTGTKDIWYKPDIGLIRSHLVWIYISAYDQEIVELMSFEFPD
ncbi:MAG: hypothetical protein GY771_12165 [bacterium]|nr:hypothetical protein [bacterium]